MSVYLALVTKGSNSILGVYPSEQELKECNRDPYIEKKDVAEIDIDTGEIIFSDGSKLVLTVQCVGDSHNGCSGETEIEYDYEANDEH